MKLIRIHKEDQISDLPAVFNGNCEAIEKKLEDLESQIAELAREIERIKWGMRE